jgi:UDP-N-acetylmuramoylalanine--D-glutamate ligase
MASECHGSTSFFTLDPLAAQRQFDGGHPVAWRDGQNLMARVPSAYGLAAGDGPVRLCSVDDILVPGQHNISNALAASLGALIMGGSLAGVNEAVRSFKGVEHRIEYVRELRGVRYYNDSIATSPDRTAALLEAVTGPLTLILGGYDKGIPFDDLARKIKDRGCAAVLLGKTAAKIEEELRKAGMNPEGIARARSLEEAVKMAAARSGPGSAVALSPACASYDMFTNFEERGRAFKDIVRRLE